MTFWQWWAHQRYGECDSDGRRMQDACPPLRTRTPDGTVRDEINWTEYSKPVVLHCWDVFACHWPQIFVAAMFGRP